MLLSIITINYKRPELTKKCLASLHEQFSKELKEHQLEVILVDNHSEDVFGVVDGNKPKEADRRLYERALEFLKNCDEVQDGTRYAKNKLELSTN